MAKLDKLKKQLDSIKSELEKLIDFRDTSFLKKFERQLEGEKSVIVAKIKKLTLTKEEKQKLQIEKVETANKNRRIKNIRNWKFWKSIQKNYRPDLLLMALSPVAKNVVRAFISDHSNSEARIYPTPLYFEPNFSFTT